MAGPSDLPHGTRRRATVRRVVPLVTMVAVVALAAAACSSDDGGSAGTSTTTTAPSESPTTPTVPPAEGGTDSPLRVAWITQVGGPGADSLSAAAGRNDAVVGVGATEGLPPDGPARPPVTRALVVDVDAASGAVRSTNVQGTDGATSARGIGSAGTTGLTVTCGATSGSFGGHAGGGDDAWCAPIDPAGAVGHVNRSGGDEDDHLDAVTVSDDGSEAYAAGATDSLYPGAQDPTGGFLGGGDALVVRLDQQGAVRWARQFGTSGPDRAEGVQTSSDGDAIVAGTTEGATDSGSQGGSDGWIARIDPYGNQRWLTQFGSPDADAAHAVGVGGDPLRGTETFVAAGSTKGVVGGGGARAGAGGEDAMAAAFNASGKQLWAWQLGSPADDSATGVVMDGSTVYVAGTAGGPLPGAKRIPLTPAPAAPAPGGSSTTAPTTTTTTTAPPGPTGRDGFLAALDASTGELRWVAQFGSTGDETVTGMTRTETGLLVLSGTTTGQLGATPPGGGVDGFLLAFSLPSAGGGAASVL